MFKHMNLLTKLFRMVTNLRERLMMNNIRSVFMH